MNMTRMEDGVGLSEQYSREGARILTQLLADQHVLLQKLRNYHWNVRGPHFTELHSLFERQYEMLAKRSDAVAERIRQLGYPAPATMTEFLQLTNLTEHPGNYPNANVMIGNILEDHEWLTRRIRWELVAEEHGGLDGGTADLLVGMMRHHEKLAWMMRATLSVAGDRAAQPKADLSETEHPEYFPYHSGGSTRGGA
jgi:starvation-inducible DNA-binding protein